MFFRLLVPIMAAALLLTPRVARAEWYEASSAHFVVYSDDRPERLKDFASKLERFDKAFRLLRGFPDPELGKASRLTIYVVDSTSTVARLSGKEDAAGFYEGRATGSVAFVPRRSGSGDVSDLGPMQILLHEYAHHMMYSMTPNAAYPLWFSEGWAEFHATAVFQKDGSVVFGSPPQYRAYGLLDGNWLKVDKLLTADTLKLNDEQREGLYGRGWLLMHFLTNGGGHPGQLGAYIKAINDGKPPIEAAGVFGDLPTLDKELEHYKTSAHFSGHVLRGEHLSIGEVGIRKLSPGEAATMPVRILSKSGVTDATAPGVYETAKRACVPYPGDAGAQMVLAEAAFDAKDYKAAEAAADRAIAADAKRGDALLYKAMARMEIARSASDTGKESWTAIRKLIASANRLDTEDPQPLILYFRSFIEEGETPPKLAREGLYRAFELAPQDEGLRMNTAQVYLRDGQPDMARALLRPLAFDPHGGELAKAAAALLAEIDHRATGTAPKPGSPGSNTGTD